MSIIIGSDAQSKASICTFHCASLVLSLPLIYRHSSETGLPPDTVPSQQQHQPEHMHDNSTSNTVSISPRFRISPGNPFANAALQAMKASDDDEDYFEDASEVEEEEDLHREDLTSLQVGKCFFFSIV